MKIKTFVSVVGVMMFFLSVPGYGTQEVVWSGGAGGYLGVSLKDVTSGDVQDLGLEYAQGVLIENVVDNSPAEQAGVREGDVILEYSGIPVISARQFQRLVSETPPERKVSMTILRNGNETTLEVEIGKRKNAFSIGGVYGPSDFAQRYFFEAKPELDDFFMQIQPGNQSLRIAGRPRLGVQAVELTPQMAEFLDVPGGEGVLIMEVTEDSPAEQAGIKAGDVITTIDGQSVATPSELKNALSGGEQNLQINRGGLEETLILNLSSAPKKKRKTSETLRL